MKKLIFMILTALSVLMVPMYVVADTYPSKTTTDKTVSQEKLQPENDTQKRETGQPEEKKQELDEIEKARQALQYGLESEILEVINKVDKRDFETLQSDFNRLFMETKSPAVREGLFGLYQKYNNTQLTDAAVAVLEAYEAQQRTLVKAVLSYLATVKPELSSGLNEAKNTYPKCCGIRCRNGFCIRRNRW